MVNPFNQPGFTVTNELVDRCIKAAGIPCIEYAAISDRELPGELFVVVVGKNKFIDRHQALISLMQRMILLIDGCDDLSGYDATATTNILASSMSWYNELEYSAITAEYFMKEADFLFRVFAEHFDGNKTHQQEYCGLFRNQQPVSCFEKINPLSDETILQAYSLVDYNDGKYFFAESESNYILFNWQSGGPLHLLVKPSKRNLGSLLLSKDTVIQALGNQNNPGTSSN